MLEAAAINKPAKPINTKQVECLHRRFAFWAWGKQQPGSTRSVDTSIGNLPFALRCLREKMGCFSRPASPRVGCGPCPPALVMDCLFDFYCNIFLCGQQESPVFHARFPRGSGAHTMRCHVTEKRTEIGKLSPRGTDKTCTQAVYAGEKPAHRCRYLAAWERILCAAPRQLTREARLLIDAAISRPTSRLSLARHGSRLSLA